MRSLERAQTLKLGGYTSVEDDAALVADQLLDAAICGGEPGLGPRAAHVFLSGRARRGRSARP